MENFKTINSAERQAYVPAGVNVVDITPQGVICTSGDNYSPGFGPYSPGQNFLCGDTQ